MKIKAKYAEKCRCGVEIKPGDEIGIYRSEHHFKGRCKACEEQFERDLEAADFDESVYNYK